MSVLEIDRHVKSLDYALKVLLSKKYVEYIKSIYLFGSCARITQKYSSDVDLFVFLDQTMSKSLFFSLRGDVSPDDYTLPEIDLHCTTSNTFSTSNAFNNNLIKEAKLIWKRD